MPTVSLTMIVRNEEANLPGCLASCAGLFDELVIVDTGSTDRTKEIAAAATDKHGRPARVFDFEWCDDFAAARNESLRRASGDWVFWIDADERLDELHRRNIGALLGMEDKMTWISRYTTEEVSIVTTPGGMFEPVREGPRVRLAPRNLAVWSGRIHESLHTREQIPTVQTPICVTHIGHIDSSRERGRNLRNVQIARKWIAELPGDPESRISLAASLAALAEYDEAIAVYKELLSLVTPNDANDVWARGTDLYARCALASGDVDTFGELVRKLESSGAPLAISYAKSLRDIATRALVAI